MEVSRWGKGVVHGGGRDEPTGTGDQNVPSYVHIITDSKRARNCTNKFHLVAPFWKLKMFLFRHGKSLIG